MGREGRQHGTVIYYDNLPIPYLGKPKTRLVNKFETPPTSSLVTKVPSKPNNHSKHTSKCLHGKPRCNGCHTKPVNKSMGKTKGAPKLGSRDSVLNPWLIKWQVGQTKKGGKKFLGTSASEILDNIIYSNWLDDHEMED